MPSELDRAYFALQDILHNIDLADEFLSGLTLEAFQRDQRTIYAVVRCLEIISEAASKRVSPEVKARHPEIEWAHIAAAGNLYRHLYEDVDHPSGYTPSRALCFSSQRGPKCVTHVSGMKWGEPHR
jgi:uncharacterized protein with HEPN domain